MNYELRLRAIGRLIDAAALEGVCVVEHDRGVLVVGLAPVTIADERVVQPTSLQLETDLIERTMRQIGGDNEPKRERRDTGAPR